MADHITTTPHHRTTTVEIRPRDNGTSVLLVKMPHESWVDLDMSGMDNVDPEGNKWLWIPLDKVEYQKAGK